MENVLFAAIKFGDMLIFVLLKFFKTDFLTDPEIQDRNEWVNKYFKDTSKKSIKYSENYKAI